MVTCVKIRSEGGWVFVYYSHQHLAVYTSLRTFIVHVCSPRASDIGGNIDNWQKHRFAKVSPEKGYVHSYALYLSMLNKVQPLLEFSAEVTITK